MPWTTGSVSSFADIAAPPSRGLLGTLLDWLAPNQQSESVGTGNGIATNFTPTLGNTPIAKGQCRIRYKIAGVVYDMWDDGEGKFFGNQVDDSTSTIDYITGACVLNFDNPIDDLYVMNAIYSTSTIEGRDWLILQNRTSRNNLEVEEWPGETPQEVILKNSGIGYKDQVIVGVRECYYVPNQFWAWNLNGYQNYPDHYGQDWNGSSVWHGRSAYYTSWGNWTFHPTMYLKDDTMQYWFIANKRRIIVIVRVTNTVYASCYIGFGKRVSTEVENELPLMILGQYAGNVNFSNTSLTGLGNPSSDNRLMTCDVVGTIIASNYVAKGWGANWPSQSITKTTNDKIIVYPTNFVNGDIAHPNTQYLYDLDGVYNCPCDVISVEDIIQIGGTDYLVVQDVYRTSYVDYYCVRLD